MTSLIPATIMFLITIAFATVCLLPMTLYKQSNEIANFYWRGLWMFLALIAGLAGGNSTLMLRRVPVDMGVSQAIIVGVLAAFVCFVVFGWFRLVGLASIALFKRARTTVTK